MSRKLEILFFVATIACSMSIFGQSAPMHVSREAVGAKSFPAAPRLAERAGIEPLAVLGAAARVVPEQLDALEQWNDHHNIPTRNGFPRHFGAALAVRIIPNAASKGNLKGAAGGVMAVSDRGVVWSGSVKVENAFRLRLHLENVRLPEGTVLWVYGDDGAPIAFDKDLLDPSNAMWTPSTSGQTIHLEVEVPAGSEGASFDLREVMEIVALGTPLKPAPNDDPSCLTDVQCVTTSNWSAVNTVKNAIAQLVYTKTEDGNSYLCSGGLLNDLANSSTPWFLTANHCIHDQPAASSMEAHWNYQFVSCVSNNFPDLNTVPRSNGATLLANSTSTDFAFMRLNSIPSGRAFLGWNANTSVVPAGTKLLRVSHPAPSGIPYPQMFSQTTVSGTVPTCTSWPRGNFLYSSADVGGTYGGSSGSPVMIASGQVVGELTGGCTTGPDQDPVNGCDSRISTVDGAFSATYPNISQYLTGNPAQPTACVQNSTTLCLAGDRFAVTATWQANDGSNGQGQAVRLTTDTGYFTFFSASNVEVVIKVLNACGLNSKYWVFAGGLTNVNVVLTVRDSKTGTVKTYTNPINTAFQPIQDTSALATCP